MILLINVLFLAITTCLLIRVRRLACECGRFRHIAQAWQDYACAIEVAYECEDDFEDVCLCKGWHVAQEQCDNAEFAVRSALAKLQELGEYPDAWECCPFLRHDGDDDE